VLVDMVTDMGRQYGCPKAPASSRKGAPVSIRLGDGFSPPSAGEAHIILACTCKRTRRMSTGANGKLHHAGAR